MLNQHSNLNNIAMNNTMCLVVANASLQEACAFKEILLKRSGVNLDLINQRGDNNGFISATQLEYSGFYKSICSYELVLVVDATCLVLRNFSLQYFSESASNVDFIGPIVYYGWDKPSSTEEIGSYGSIPSIRRIKTFYKVYSVLERHRLYLEQASLVNDVNAIELEPRSKSTIPGRPTFSKIALLKGKAPESIVIAYLASATHCILRCLDHHARHIFTDHLPHIQYEKHRSLPIIARCDNLDYRDWLNTKIMPIAQAQNVIIATTPHAEYISHCLADYITSIGFRVYTVVLPLNSSCNAAVEDVCREEELDDFQIIVISANAFEDIPHGAIIIQLEQLHTSRWLDEGYKSVLTSAKAVLDYSTRNIGILRNSLQLPLQSVFYLPIPQSVNSDIDAIQSIPFSERDIDILFYGDIHCERRQKAFEVLSARFNCLFVCDIFGKELDALIARARLILNIHYYSDAQLETVRVKEALSKGCVVVSEDSENRMEFYRANGEPVYFFEQGDFDECIRVCSALLTSPETWEKSKEHSIWHIHRQFSIDYLWLQRALIGINFYSLEDAYSKVILAENLRSDSGEQSIFTTRFGREGVSVVLSLPETSERLDLFREHNAFKKFNVFPGIKHQIGWLGCGLSYMLLFEFLEKSSLDFLEVIEDDAIVSPDHEVRRLAILDYLESRMSSWDIFCGLVTDVGPHFLVREVSYYRGLRFVFFSGMTGMVSNIYKKSACKFMREWRPQDANVYINSIDRFLENQSELQCVTTIPYYASLAGEASSTLWEGAPKNSNHYFDLISASEAKVMKLADAFERDLLGAKTNKDS